MRNSLKNQISELLSNKKGKQYMLIAFKRQPDIYEHDGKEYNEVQFEKLKTKYKNVITFVEVGCGDVSNDNAETFLKLKDIK